MTAVRQYGELVVMTMRMYRQFAAFTAVLQVALTLGFVIGFGYIIPEVDDATALYLTTGAATASLVTIGLVALPQTLAEAKAVGRLEYMLSLPISREAYLLSQASVTFVYAMPGLILSILLGAWHYNVSITFDPFVLLVVPVAAVSLSGVGVAMAVLSKHQQVTNALTQLIIFYVFFFAPVLIPRAGLPEFLQVTADVLPPTYAADAIRATLTDLPGTNLYRSLLVLTLFAFVSLGAASISVRRRG